MLFSLFHSFSMHNISLFFCIFLPFPFLLYVAIFPVISQTHLRFQFSPFLKLENVALVLSFRFFLRHWFWDKRSGQWIRFFFGNGLKCRVWRNGKLSFFKINFVALISYFYPYMQNNCMFACKDFPKHWNEKVRVYKEAIYFPSNNIQNNSFFHYKKN